MSDYVVKINDVVPWRIALEAEYAEGSKYVHKTDEGENKIEVMDEAGDPTGTFVNGLINDINDITWITGGKGFYHSIHKQTPYDVDAGEGGIITINPPLLHCVIAS